MICPPDVRRAFRGFTPPPPPEPQEGLRHEPIVELAAPQDLHLHFTTFENSIFVQRRALVKLLG